MLLISSSAVLLLVAFIYPQGLDATPNGYHEKIGIPLAIRIEAREKAISFDESSRIYKGFAVDIEHYPFFASLVIIFELSLFVHFSLCGSTLISSNRLITAAHCWFDGDKTPSHFEVVLGSNYLTKGGLRIQTKDIRPHPNYHGFDSDKEINDIAMIYLPNKIEFSSKIFPIALPTGKEMEMSFSSLWGHIVGVGLTEWVADTGNDRPDDDDPSLHRGNVRIISNQECETFIQNVYDSMMCTSWESGADNCDGDSGGPLYTHTADNKLLVGVIMGGSIGDCGHGSTAVFTRVTKYMDFIKSHATLPLFIHEFEKKNNTSYERITARVKRE